MKVAVFSSQTYDREFLSKANAEAGHQLVFIEQALQTESAALATGCEAVCIFVNDKADVVVLEKLSELGVRLLALRCTGFNHVDLVSAKRLGISVVRVSDYSPNSVAEHATLLLMALNRKLPLAIQRIKANNFVLDGLMGFDLVNKTIGIIGTGRIGMVFANIMRGFGCRLLAYDPIHNPDFIAMGGQYVDLQELASQSDTISLHCPMLPETRYLVNSIFLAAMKKDAILINTSRGAVVDTKAVMAALQSGQLAGFGMDVYEFEAGLFFCDRSQSPIDDALLAELQAMPNVLITGHQGFFTHEAISAICQTSIDNISDFAEGRPLRNRVPD